MEIQIKDSGPKLVFTTSELLPLVQKATDEWKIQIILTEFQQVLTF